MSERLQGHEGQNQGVVLDRVVTRKGGEELVLRLNKQMNGTYNVDGLGTIGVGVAVSETGTQQVILNIEQCPELQGSKQRLERRIDVGNGYGAQAIGHNKMLRIDTGEHKRKGHGNMRPEWRRNGSLAYPNGWRMVWVKA